MKIDDEMSKTYMPGDYYLHCQVSASGPVQDGRHRVGTQFAYPSRSKWKVCELKIRTFTSFIHQIWHLLNIPVCSKNTTFRYTRRAKCRRCLSIVYWWYIAAVNFVRCLSYLLLATHFHRSRHGACTSVTCDSVSEYSSNTETIII